MSLQEGDTAVSLGPVVHASNHSRRFRFGLKASPFESEARDCGTHAGRCQLPHHANFDSR